MEIRNRLFPYPVLCDETDDYVQGDFWVDMTLSETINDLTLAFDFNLQNNELLELIRLGKAKYVIHLECSVTAYRKVYKLDVTHLDCKISKSRVNKEMTVLAMVVADRDIKDFKSDSLNNDYIGETINYDRGSILAYRNIPKIVITKDYEELSGNEALFSILRIEYPDQDEDHMIDFDLNDDRIKIKVDSKTYDAYIKFQQSSSFAMSLFVMPAVLYMIDTVRDAESCSMYEDKVWFIKMKRFYKSQGKDFLDELIGEGRKNAVELAQEMLKLPIGKAYQELMEMGD